MVFAQPRTWPCSLERSLRGQKTFSCGRVGLPVRSVRSFSRSMREFLRATMAQVRQRAAPTGAVGDWMSHLGLNWMIFSPGAPGLVSRERWMIEVWTCLESYR